MALKAPEHPIETHPFKVKGRLYKTFHGAKRVAEAIGANGDSQGKVWRRLPALNSDSYFARDRMERVELVYVATAIRPVVIESNIDGHWRGSVKIERSDGSVSWCDHIGQDEIATYRAPSTIVLDKEAALTARPSLAFSAPMLNPVLKGMDRFEGRYPGVRDRLAQMRDGLSGGYETLADLVLNNPQSVAFDYFGPEEYAAWWVARGAKVLP